jgi:hypothetical protein
VLAKRFQALIGQETPFKFPNSGMWIGRRKEVEDAFGIMQRMHDEAATGREIYPEAKNCGNPGDDQWLWQMIAATQEVPTMIDGACKLFANIWGTEKVFTDLEACCKNGRVVTPFGTNPLAIHFNGNHAGLARWLSLLRSR